MRASGPLPLPPWLVAVGAFALDLRLEVAPHPRRARIVGAGERLRLQLVVASADAFGNQALAAFLAARLGVARAQVSVVVGHASWRKAVHVGGLSPLRALLALSPPATGGR